MVIWIIGMSGTGKSTLALEVARLVREKGVSVTVLDGDVMRDVWGDSPGHDLEGRRKNAERLHRLSSYLEGEGIHVIAPVLSIFQETRDDNRRNLQDYYEVYIKSPLEALKERDPKGLYAKAMRGEIELPGINMRFDEPLMPDLTIENIGTQADLLSYAPMLASKLLGIDYLYIGRDLLREPEKYFYTPFQGREFINAWKRSREKYLFAWSGSDKLEDCPADLSETELTLWRMATCDQSPSDQDTQLIENLLRRFEISKKLPVMLIPPRYSCQRAIDCLMRPHAYACFGAILAQHLARKTDLRKLNCLLKINDLLCSLPSLPALLHPLAKRSVKGEIEAVKLQLQGRQECSTM